MPLSFMFFKILTIGVLLDQIIKFIVRENMRLGESHNILGDFFKFTYVENTGIAFSFMKDNPIFLYILPAIILVGGTIYLFKNIHKYSRAFEIGMGLVISGGLSNLVDRIILGSVTDYLDLKYFAVFNLADIFINIGIIFILFSLFRKDEKDARK